MNLKEKRTKILTTLQRNRADIIRNEHILEGLNRGTIHLKAQLELIDELISEESASQVLAKSEEKPNENVSTDLQSASIPTAPAAPPGTESSSGSTPGDNSSS
jgi:hypothetical protein